MRSALSGQDKWMLDFFGAAESEAGIPVGPESAQRNAVVYACVNVRAQDLAKLPLNLYRRRADGRGRDKASDNPLFDLLANRPNSHQTSFEWREMMQQHRDLRGNGYSRILRDGRMTPRELIPLHPDWVRVKISPDGEPFYELRMWGTGKVETLSSRDILHIRGRSDDGYVGKSCISQERDVIGLALASSKHAAKVFANGARPGGIITHPGKIGEPARDHFEKKWQDKFSGDNSYKIAVFPEGMKYEKVGMTNEDAQFVDLMKMSNSDIARIFRLPPHKVGIMDNATFSNIEHQSLEYVMDTLLPEARRWEQAINTALLRETERADYFFEFNFDALLRGDFATRMNGYAMARQWGWLSANDIREKENMNPIEGGDTYLEPLNMWPTNEPRPEKTAAPAADPPPSKKALMLVHGIEANA